MTIDELLKNKAIKPKEKTEAISKWILDKSLPVDELIAFADKQKTQQKKRLVLKQWNMQLNKVKHCRRNSFDICNEHADEQKHPE